MNRSLNCRPAHTPGTLDTRGHPALRHREGYWCCWQVQKQTRCNLHRTETSKQQTSDKTERQAAARICFCFSAVSFLPPGAGKVPQTTQITRRRAWRICINNNRKKRCRLSPECTSARQGCAKTPESCKQLAFTFCYLLR